ncbi:saccharopine dehydrogenase NADP-binding domain-containing protein [Gordonia sp. PDNC005]|uniref:saccharopine dehydrogenase family protein n=1 Tax=unclassified Gordonia (in: high G+C Gram-positive bacteria) TaxID=2657482 RepID=UPI001964299C|nr:saccharopine dehydrogenase NADP-binding domain-containing protein [Gordonia sp. PDNC005]QRY64120.1 saccharopine dehydrogenase NADP-binding domain-containing protein [Gordonia sp. PDNC005]
MTGRIVVFGATGYAGGLAVESLVRRGERPVLAGRSSDKLATFAERLGGLEYRVADVAQPASVRALVEAGDVMVTGVGPFERVGWVAAEAAVDAGAHYVDSTGEIGFVRQLVSSHDTIARDRGAVMLPAFGYDYVPGVLAGHLAAREAGDQATSIDVGYFATGPLRRGLSQGTRKTLADGLTLPVTVFADGRHADRRAASDVVVFPVQGARRRAILASGTEVLQLPEAHPHLRNVRVFNGWFPSLARPMQAASFAAAMSARSAAGRRVLSGVLSRTSGPAGGPDETERAKVRGLAVAVARDDTGRVLSEVEVDGPSPYSVTAELMAVAAQRLARGLGRSPGVVGPVDGLGEDGFTSLCDEVGLRRVR